MEVLGLLITVGVGLVLSAIYPVARPFPYLRRVSAERIDWTYRCYSARSWKQFRAEKGVFNVGRS